MQLAIPTYVTPDYLASLALCHGRGDGTPGHRCVVQEIRAWLDLDPAKDDIPPCVSPIIGRFLIHVNDRYPKDEAGAQMRSETLVQYLARVIGTRGTDAIERKRAWALADFAVRTLAAEAM